IGQALKGLMNTNFQISKSGRMVPQLGQPLRLLILQLLLHLPQHFVNVLHHGPTLSFDTHFHTPPAFHGVQLVCRLHKAYSIPKRFGWPLFGNRPDELVLHPWPVPVPKDWLKWVNEPQTEQEVEAVRRALVRCSPYGSPVWQQRTARRLGLESSLRPSLPRASANRARWYGAP